MSAQYKIQEILYPLFVDDPSVFLYATALHNPMSSSRMNSLNNTGFGSSRGGHQQYGNSSSSYGSAWDRHTSSSSNNETTTSPPSKCLFFSSSFSPSFFH